jgi:large subunit ribosomal protein L14
MIFPESILYAADNGGGQKMKCIGGLRDLRAGDELIVTVHRAKWKRKVKKGKAYRGVLIQTRRWTRRPFGNQVKFCSNRVVLLKRGENVPIGSRVTKFSCYELRKKGFLKIVTLSPGQI